MDFHCFLNETVGNGVEGLNSVATCVLPMQLCGAAILPGTIYSLQYCRAPHLPHADWPLRLTKYSDRGALGHKILWDCLAEDVLSLPDVESVIVAKLAFVWSRAFPLDSVDVAGHCPNFLPLAFKSDVNVFVENFRKIQRC